MIPFPSRGGSDGTDVLGEVIADDLIAQLSRQRQLHVVSRLSTTVFRQREPDLPTLVDALGSHYVVHGSCTIDGDRVRLRAQLVDCRDADVIWADALDGKVTEVLGGEMARDRLAVRGRLPRVAGRRDPARGDHALAIAAELHHFARRDRDDASPVDPRLHPCARDARVPDRAPSAGHRATGLAGQVARDAGGPGLVAHLLVDAQQARSVVAQALDLEPQHSLALAIDGLICAYINKDLATAEQRYDAAVRANPSESLAWLFQAALHSYASDGERAVDCAMRAQHLSPSWIR